MSVLKRKNNQTFTAYFEAGGDASVGEVPSEMKIKFTGNDDIRWFLREERSVLRKMITKFISEKFYPDDGKPYVVFDDECPDCLFVFKTRQEFRKHKCID